MRGRLREEEFVEKLVAEVERRRWRRNREHAKTRRHEGTEVHGIIQYDHAVRTS
jgi:hypothetical protein